MANNGLNNKKRRYSLLQAARHLLQILLFFLLPGLYISAFSGIQSAYSAAINGQFHAAEQIPQLIPAIAVIPLTILLGRFFCGWMCAFGAMEDLLYGVSDKLLKAMKIKRRFRISESLDEALKYVKYVILIVLIVAGWTLGSSLFSAASPWDAFGMLFTIGKAPAWEYVAANLTVGLIYLVLIMVGSLFVERFFCRYLCPLGAVFALTSRLRIAKIRKTRTQCGSCRACTNACAMGLPLYRVDKVTSGECIQCMKCVSACPRSNATLTVSQSDVRPLAAGAAAAAIMTGIYYVGNFSAGAASALTVTSSAPASSTGESSSEASSSAPDLGAGSSSSSQPSSSSQDSASSSQQASSSSPTVASGKYKDGTYQGSGTGFRGGSTTVSVTVSGGRVTDISTVSTDDDMPFYSRAFSTVSGEIVSSQSSSVDAVSGATYSSRGIMSAVSDALSKAK